MERGRELTILATNIPVHDSYLTGLYSTMSELASMKYPCRQISYTSMSKPL